MKKWYVLFIAIALTACTDYVNQIEDEREDWRNAQELAALSSNSSSSSAILSSEGHEEFSSSSVKSSDSSSSTNLSSESLDGSSSSDAKSCSSEKTTSSSSEKNASSSSSAKSNGSSSSSENAASIDVNDPPLVRDTMFSIDENLANGSSVGKIIAFDPDTIIAYCTLIYDIIESDVPFILDSNIIKVGDSRRLDYEVNPVFTFHVRVSDGMFGDTALVVVKLKDENEMQSSSSSGKASWAYLNPAISYGEMTDDRDGQVYKTVVIGEQTWMAENLNFAVTHSSCYNSDTSYCAKYGRLYQWWYGAQDACPSGWHLPTEYEFESLITTVGSLSTEGVKLKSLIGWSGSGNDIYGFSAIPAGAGYVDYSGEGSSAYFWSSTTYGDNSVYAMNLQSIDSYSSLGYFDKYRQFSVRCVRDKEYVSGQSSVNKNSWKNLNSTISYGEMYDNRDKQIYKTVKIGEQTWMAENLNYAMEKSKCYKDSLDNCLVYGRLYNWDAAAVACPSGWHLPSRSEYRSLTSFVGETNGASILKSKTSWDNNLAGIDTYGFSVVPAGREANGSFVGLGDKAYFWNSTEANSAYAYYIQFYNANSYTNDSYEYKFDYRFSVRCLKNENETPKSSSSITSSSSKASWVYLNPAISYGEITDDRDGQVYKTVEIGEQTWMAENLNYEIEPYKQNYEVVQSFCYNDSAKYCEKYGRLYTWDAAKRACPTDWRLPTNVEFHTLVDTVGGVSIAGKMLTSFGKGTNDYGFSGLPSGMWNSYYGYYEGEGTAAFFWSSTEFDTEFNIRGAYYMMLVSSNGYAYLDGTGDPNTPMFYKEFGYSVRCIKK